MPLRRYLPSTRCRTVATPYCLHSWHAFFVPGKSANVMGRNISYERPCNIWSSACFRGAMARRSAPCALLPARHVLESAGSALRPVAPIVNAAGCVRSRHFPWPLAMERVPKKRTNNIQKYPGISMNEHTAFFSYTDSHTARMAIRFRA